MVQKGKIDYRSIKEEQKELDINKSLSFAGFKKAWMQVHGTPTTARDKKFVAGQGLKDFYEDYMTSTSKNVYVYLRSR